MILDNEALKIESCVQWLIQVKHCDHKTERLIGNERAKKEKKHKNDVILLIHAEKLNLEAGEKNLFLNIMSFLSLSSHEFEN